MQWVKFEVKDVTWVREGRGCPDFKTFWNGIREGVYIVYDVPFTKKVEYIGVFIFFFQNCKKR